MSGTVITFYSYKGGVGRSFALANIAVLLAQWRYRVLMVDWDIEAPGLAHYFRPWTAKPSIGVLNLLQDCERGVERPWQSYTAEVALPGLDDSLALLPAGPETKEYIHQVQRIDWNRLYQDHDFGAVLEKFREAWTDHFDFVLVDARTGITDFSGLLTAQLPDILAFLFTANQQSLDGACDVVDRAAAARTRLPYDRSSFFALPLPARFEVGEEYEQANKWRGIFVERLSRFTDPWRSKGTETKRLIEHLIIPDFPYWSFGEEIAVLKEETGSPLVRHPGMISFAFETIAALLAHRLGRTDLLDRSRDDYVHSARRAGTRREPDDHYDVFLSYARSDGQSPEKSLIRCGLMT
jgi:MinD-like ATPase involved in chromosome partitioning or flagellar assembly